MFMARTNASLTYHVTSTSFFLQQNRNHSPGNKPILHCQWVDPLETPAVSCTEMTSFSWAKTPSFSISQATMQLYKSVPKRLSLDSIHPRHSQLHKNLRFAGAEISRICCDCTMARPRVGTPLQRREEGKHHQQRTLLRHWQGAGAFCGEALPCATADGAEEETCYNCTEAESTRW